MIETSEPEIEWKKTIGTKGLYKRLALGSAVLIMVILILLFSYVRHLNSPLVFNEPITVVIEEGDSVPLITEKLESAKIVRSGELLYLILATFFDPTKIKASRYIFSDSQSTFQIAESLIKGDFDTDLQSVTIFEGESREKIALRLESELSWFDPDLFLELTNELEGKLFPDTYFVPESYTTKDLAALLNKTHTEVMLDYEEQIQVSNLSPTEVLTLASIVEREANTPQSMGLVAGIFLNRLNIGMALQADASIEYVLEHELNELAPGLLAESLREIDSPYNTYLYPGIPPTPIGNPGRVAIESVLTPTQSDYLYYLTAPDGTFYYAETYRQHLLNIDKYLR